MLKRINKKLFIAVFIIDFVIIFLSILILSNSIYNQQKSVGAGVFLVIQGGTSSTSLGGILAGDGTSAVKSVVIGSNLTWDGTTLSSTGGSSDLQDYISYTAASSTLFTLSGGIIETGSSTFNGELHTDTLYASSSAMIGGTLYFPNAHVINWNDGDVLLTHSSNALTISGGNFVGNLTGNADTATALASNGANCSAGNSPLGVDQNGAVESCFDVWTEAENTSAGYVGTSALQDYITWTYASTTLFTLSGGIIETGSSTFNGGLHTDTLYASSTVDFGGLTILESGLISQASSTIASNLYVQEAISASSTLAVNGISNFYGGIIVADTGLITEPRGEGLDLVAGSLDVGAGACITVGSNSVAVTSNCTDAATVDSIEGASFLRSDAADEATGLITFSAGLLSTASSTFTGYLNAQQIHASSTLAVGDLASLYGGFIAASSTVTGDFTVDASGILRLRPRTDCTTAPDNSGELCLSVNGISTATTTSVDPIGLLFTEKSIGAFTIGNTASSTNIFDGTAKFLSLGTRHYGYTLNKVFCNVWGGTSVTINFTDDTGNDTNSITCTTATSTQHAIIQNSVFTSGEGITLEITAVSGSVESLFINPIATTTPQ